LHVDTERFPVRGRPSSLAGLSPELRGEAKGLITERNLSMWRGVQQRIQAGNSESFVSSQKFAFNLLVDNGWHQDASAGAKAVLEPICYSDNFLATLRTCNETEWTRIEEKNIAHG
jgi:hypothetical protein